MPKWLIPAVITYSSHYIVEAESAGEAVKKLETDDFLADAFEDMPSGGEVEVFEDSVERFEGEIGPARPQDRELYAKIMDVLVHNESRCMDDDRDRLLLAKALFNALRGGAR